MKKTLALIHTSPVLVPSFQKLAQEILDGANLFNIVDESLIRNTITAGRLEKSTIRRLVNHVESARNAGADAVLVTCSSIGPCVNVARMLYDFPVLRIDERMAERAVTSGNRVGVLATLLTTMEPTVELLRDTAAQLGREVEIESSICAGAFEAVLNGDTETHDRRVTRSLLELAGRVDVIVLAQASMARVVDQIPAEAVRVPVLSSPRLAMEQARETLASLDTVDETSAIGRK